MRIAEASRDALIKEVETLRARVAELEAWNETYERVGEAFLRSGETFRKVFDHSNDGIFIIDPAGDRIVDVNQRACDMLGYTFEELVAKPVSAVHPNDLPRLRRFAADVTSNGNGLTRELICRTRDGRELPVELSGSMIDLPNGRYLIALVRDISDRRETEARLREAHTRMRADLEAAAKLQRSLLPCATDRLPGVKAAWEYRPSEELGGDLLNVFRLDDDHVGMYVLDVSGHGVMAAMQSLTLHRTLSPFPNPTSLLLHQIDWETQEVVPPGHVATELSRMFPMTQASKQYFTLLYGVFRPSTREFRFVSAGHCAPLLLDPRGEVRPLAEYGFPIGVFPDAPYEDHTVILEPGSRLLLYSDGVTEAMDPEQRLFGVERVSRVLRDTRERPLEELTATLIQELKEWICASCPRDDVSLLAVEV